MTEQIIYGVEGESDEFKAAVASAQATFKYFWRELSWEARRIVKGLDMAAVKMSFPIESDDPEVPSVENNPNRADLHPCLEGLLGQADHSCMKAGAYSGRPPQAFNATSTSSTTALLISCK